MEDSIVQSYVWHGDKGFFVSTINRPSSAAAAYGRVYAETMVWEWDAKTRERGVIVGQDEAGEDSIRSHLAMVKRLHETGQCELPDEA